MIRERIQHIRYSEHANSIIAGGREGGLYALDLDLQVQKATPVTKYNFPICALACSDQYIFSKDNMGNIARWNLETFRAMDYLVSGEYSDSSILDEDDVVIPSTNHAIALLDQDVYVTNGYGQLLVIDQESFTLQRVLDPVQDAHIETIETRKKGLHAVSDFKGFVTFLDLETEEIKNKVRIDYGPVHCVKYDARHNRFWATTDNNYAFYLLSTEGEVIDSYSITNDDIEWIDFNPDATTAYLACFDHHLYVYSNDQAKPALKQVIGPFKFQLKQVLCIDDDHIYVLLESGEIYQVNKQGEVVNSASFMGNSIWGLDAHPEDDSIVYAALEDSSVAVLQYDSGNYGTINLTTLNRHQYAFGRIRRVMPFKDGSFTAVASSGTVFRANSEGEILWHTKLLGICRDVDINVEYTKILVGTEANLAAELNAETGEILHTFHLAHPVWAVSYSSDGQIVIGTRRQLMYIYDGQTYDLKKEVKVRDNIKRYRRLHNGHILMNGPEGIIEFNPEDWSIAKDWNEWVTTTVENAYILNGFVHTVSYSYALTSYDYESGEVVDNQISVPDFPKGIAGRTAQNGQQLLLVGGRGAYVTVYRVSEEGEPIKIRDMYL